MELVEASSFCKTFKGAALSCLILMWAVRHKRRTFTRDDLARLTGWSRETVADGLYQLELNGLIFRVSRYKWQLTDQGFQLSFDERGVEKIDSEGAGPDAGSRKNRLQSDENPTGGVDKIDSGSSRLIETHDHESMYLKNLLLLQNGVEKIDSPAFRETIFDELVQQLIAYGCSPLNARESIVEALGRETSAKDLKLRIMWWRVYCLAHPKIDHPGNLIAARVAKGIDKPKDFGVRDIPDRYYELGQEIEDLEREIESVRLNGNGQPQQR